MNRHGFLVIGFVGLIGGSVSSIAAEPALRERAASTLRRATECFRKEVATEGGYLWLYSEDLGHREGEVPATSTMVWVQPPGTPSVGLSYLKAFNATQDPYYRDAAREVALALVKGQLRSGGWDYLIEFDPKLRPQYGYRVDSGAGGKRNVTTLDDNTTQEALRLLMRVDQTLEFHDTAIHEAVVYALAKLIEAQYPNGAWPQRFDRPPDPARFPVKPASYPESWSRTYPSKDYKTYYTLNDNALGDTIDVMLEAARIYQEPRYRDSAKKGGDFLLLAQMPEPQPAWAQQYDADMHPAWARKFEPPSITGLESQSAIAALLQISRETGDARYLGAVPKALEYLKKSRLVDGRLARFYELRTNTPLYFTKDYRLTESDADMPTHYGFKVSSNLDRLDRTYREIRELDPSKTKLKPGSANQSRPSTSTARQRSSTLAAEAEAVIADISPRGLWLAKPSSSASSRLSNHPGERSISTSTFNKNLQILSRYLESTRP